MLSEKLENKGICYGCHQEITAESMLSHLEQCRGKSMATRHKHHEQSEKIYSIHVETENKFWLVAEAKGSLTLTDLYMFLRSNWFECCGHISPFILEDKPMEKDYMQKTLADIFVVGDHFRYEHNAGVPMTVVGKIVEVKSGHSQTKNAQLASRKIIKEERCETCIADTN